MESFLLKLLAIRATVITKKDASSSDFYEVVQKNEDRTKMRFSVMEFFSKCDQIQRKPKKSLMQKPNFSHSDNLFTEQLQATTSVKN